MNFIVSANTDVGIVKDTNQDSMLVKVANTSDGRLAFAVVCDGMGGLKKGEVASASLINAFNSWFTNKVLANGSGRISAEGVADQWNFIIQDMNNKLKAYGAKHELGLGTTAAAMLITKEWYVILNVGDSRAYEIYDSVKQLTVDQTFVAREIMLGNMTEEEAKTDKRRNMLLQCVGASDEVRPDVFYGETKKDAVYMLCSDGFRHEITESEIYDSLSPYVLVNEDVMNTNSINLIELDKARNERDNISVLLIRTY